MTENVPDTMGELTPNEKAATFIGWVREECDLCKAWLDANPTHTASAAHPTLLRPGVTISCHFPLHQVYAPDMSDPKQFWKALESRAAQISAMVDNKGAWNYLLDAIYIALRDRNPDAIISYLVRRYDEEHDARENTNG